MVSTLTPIEIIAGLFLLISSIKILVVLGNKKKWLNGVVKPIYSNPKTSAGISAILAVAVFYYLLSDLTIVQVFAAFALFSLLMILGMLSYSKDLLEFARKIYAQKISFAQWIYIIFWIALMIWGAAQIIK